MEPTPAEDAVEVAEMTAKDLAYPAAAAGFERIDSNLESSSTAGKMLSAALHATGKSLVKVGVNQCCKLHCVLC